MTVPSERLNFNQHVWFNISGYSPVNFIGWVEQKTFEVLKEGVTILLNESIDVVDNIPGIMANKEVLKISISWKKQKNVFEKWQVSR